MESGSRTKRLNAAVRVKISPLAGRPAPSALLVDVARLVTAYYTDTPDASIAAQRVAFGTSGHRGTAFNRSFNEWHVLAISQAICQVRKRRGVDGPLFLGMDTHALSTPASASVLEVLAANGVEVMLALRDEYTPTPAVSLAILTYNRGRTSGLADGIVVTPSHNPPETGGIKYNPPHGGPADEVVTGAIEEIANALLHHKIKAVRRMPLAASLRAPTTHRYNFLRAYVNALGRVIDMDVLRGATLRIGADPLGGAGVHYWTPIAERYGLNLTLIDDKVDPTFRFMTVDWDGQIRMDPSSAYALQTLIGMRDRFDIAFACDTDHDRHGIVTRKAGLLPANHYQAVVIDYLFRHRPRWPQSAAVGKSIVSSQLIDRAAATLGRGIYEVPVGFKWFVDGLRDGSLGVAGEESAGATFARLDGKVWTTDKDGITPALLAAEMTERMGRDPGELYEVLARNLGEPTERRVQATATPKLKKRLAQWSPAQFHHTELAGEKIENVLDRAPGNGARIGGLKVIAKSGWFAARPSGTENIYKIYAESFRGKEHLERIVDEAQVMVDDLDAGTTPRRPR
jgi:phosphoglucomutase